MGVPVKHLLAAAIVIVLGVMPVSAKTGSVIITAQMRENAVRNVERYEWAKQRRDAVVSRVQRWMEMSDEELWRLLPSQEMPRDSSVNFRSPGCPNCGMDHYKAPYNPSRWHWDFDEHPWQAQCRNCNQWFPSNDFAAYYQSALDEQGKFRLGAGDPQYLKPIEGANPEWIDDGTGVKIGDGKWFFAAHYAFQVWHALIDAAEDLATAYTLTNDARYAHKAAVILDRMADLYPEMDYSPHYRLGMEASTGGSGKGRVQGCIWETFTAQKLSSAYDFVYDAMAEDAELVAFSQGMAGQYGTGEKSSTAAIAEHIEQHMLREFVIGLKDGRLAGNAGMDQHAMALAAIALDHPSETEEYLDWLFEPDGGQIPFIMQQRLCREGFSDESGVGYASIPAQSFQEVAERLRRYAAYDKHDLYRDYPKFRNCYTMCAKTRMLDTHTPHWGDSGKCMAMGTTGMTMPLQMMLRGYRVYGTPEVAREVWFSNGKKLDGIAGDIYDAEPQELLERLKRELDQQPGPFVSHNAGGYGQAALEAPSRKHPRGVAMYYGRTGGHGHEDRLAIDLVSNNVLMTPDMGYPLYTGHWPKRIGWTSHVISHNTCMVNDKGQDRGSFSGKTKLFADAGPVRVADVDGGKVYPDVSTYRRCLVMVDVDEVNSYLLDLFWVRGGTNHRLIQNGGGPEVETTGLTLTAQEGGTYAGKDVEFGEFYDGPSNWDYDGTGFMYLKDVEKSGPAERFTVDWKMLETWRTMPQDWEAHLRVHNLSPVDEVALCTGVPPEYKGAPERLRYMLRTRYGSGLNTQFVSVLEPYATEPFITSVRSLGTLSSESDFGAAVEVVLADGRRDVILVRENEGKLEAGGVEMDGRVGFCRFERDRPVAQVLIEGTALRAGEVELRLPASAVRGKLAGWDDGNVENTLLKLDTALPESTLMGEYIIFDNAERSDASYLIESVIDARTVGIGSNSLVERFVDENDYGKGFVYTIAEGDSFIIPLSASWERQE